MPDPVGAAGPGALTFAERLVAAAKLDPRLYEEVEADRGATRQALAVVVLASVAAGLGAGRWNLGGMLVGAAMALVGWVVWASLIYWIGTRLFPEPGTRADVGELLRVVGFASAPGLVRLLGVVPPLREIAFVAAGIWVLLATVIAVRQALDYRGTLRAVGVCAVGWVVQMLLVALALHLAAPGRPG